MKPSHITLFTALRLSAVFACLVFLHREWHALLDHQSVHSLAASVATFAAASLIWIPNRSVRGWTWTAFITLLIGMTLVALTTIVWRFAAILAIVVAAMRLWHLHRRPNPPRITVIGTNVLIPLEMKITPQVVLDNTRSNQRPTASESQIEPEEQVLVNSEISAGSTPKSIRPAETPPAKAATQPATMPADSSDYVRQPRHDFSAVVGMHETKSRLLRAAREIVDGTATNRNGMLLHGPAGSGKTFFAEAIAAELGLPLISISYGAIASRWVNHSPQLAQAVFDQARRVGACVLFIDEFDSFVKARDGHNTHSMDRDLTNVMLTQIVALRGSKVILIAAPNFLDGLDPAAQREGRFDYKIEIPPPDLNARIALISTSIVKELGNEYLAHETIAALAGRWEGFSAARMTAIGGQLREMHRDGIFTRPVTFDAGMKAMRLLQGRKGRLPESVKDISEIIMPEASQSALQDLAYRMQNLEDLQKLGSVLPRGLVFAGRPGTGKTQAAMSLAKAADWAFLKTTGADIIADPHSWDRLYAECRDIRPCVLFIDEAEGILQDRLKSGYGIITEKILVTLDGADGSVPDILVIAASNHADRFDPAAIRSGRLEERILFDVPTSKAMATYVRKTLIRKLQGWEVEPDAIGQLLRILAGRTIADADALVRKAITVAALRRVHDRTTDFRADDVIEGAHSIFA
jgi:transitional endoplasmic reticulum ATPase